jgi:hypothetical protein
MDGAFSILEFKERSDPEVAVADGVGGVAFLEKDREVRVCTEAFDRLRAAALSPGASLQLIHRAAGDLQ